MLKLKMVVSVSKLKGECIGKAKRGIFLILICFILFLIESLILSLHLISISSEPALPVSLLFESFYGSFSLYPYFVHRSNSVRQWHSSILIEKVFSSSEVFSTTDENNLARLPKTIMIVHLFSLGSHKFCASLSQLSILFKCFHFDFSFYVNESGSVNVVIAASCCLLCHIAFGHSIERNRHVSHQSCFMLCFFCVLL